MTELPFTASLRDIYSKIQDPIPPDWLRFFLREQPIGWIAPARVPAMLAALPGCHVGKLAVRWEPKEHPSAEIQTAAERLRDAGLIPGWRSEQYALLDNNSAEILRLERAAFRFFGLRSRAVHINGYTNNGYLWVGRRAAHKATDPNRLDNLAAGGISAGEPVFDCAVRESGEEAGVPLELARQMTASTTLHSIRLEPEGLHDEVLYVFDLLLPDDFTPTNHDGEVAGFTLMSIDEAIKRLQANEFTRDAAAVTAGLLLRMHSGQQPGTSPKAS